jgi:DNA mismatch repair ATPase MutS
MTLLCFRMKILFMQARPDSDDASVPRRKSRKPRMPSFYFASGLRGFFDDAVTASRELEITTLTARNKERDNPVPMCGVPYHAADGHIARLLRRYKVAPATKWKRRKGIKLVKRVTRVITPGTVTDTNVLSPGENNFCSQ